MRLLEAQEFAPPSLAEAMQQTGADAEMVRALAQRGDIVRVSDDVAFGKEAYAAAVAIVKEIVGRHGGSIVLEGAAPRGLRAVMRLPRAT